jgi:hypothetical protein
VVSRRYGSADQHIIGDVAATTNPEMASVCAGANVGVRYRCYDHRR